MGLDAVVQSGHERKVGDVLGWIGSLEEHPAQQAGVAGSPLDSVEHGGDQLRGVGDRCDGVRKVLFDGEHRRSEQGLFGSEVVVNESVVDAGAFCDLADADVPWRSDRAEFLGGATQRRLDCVLAARRGVIGHRVSGSLVLTFDPGLALHRCLS